MLPPEYSNSTNSIQGREFEQHIQDAIIAIKNGNHSLGKRLLEQAAMVNNTDPRIWIWLSATTDDLQERKECLEHAIALDPANSMAKRGLLLLNEKLDKKRLMAEGEGYTPQKAPATEEASARTFTCPNCGAAIAYDVHDLHLVCRFCGFTRKVDESLPDEQPEQVLEAALPTSRAHRWAESQTRLTCEQCGVTVLLPPGQMADTCPYCASNRFVTSPELMEIIDPQVIGLFKLDPDKAAKSVRAWLGKGLLAPDELSLHHAGMQLKAAYYPFWLFSGTLEVPWFCDVNIGSGGEAVWEAHTGSQFEMFDQLLIPGLRKMPMEELRGIEPFDLKDLVDFSPETLAGWVALTYDQPLADASLSAREIVVKNTRHKLSDTVEPTKQKRNFKTGAGRWSGLTYKLALLPVYAGNYSFRGTRYRLLVNGQTGKVTGKKPVDGLKAVLYSLAGILLLVILVIILSLLKNLLTG